MFTNVPSSITHDRVKVEANQMSLLMYVPIINYYSVIKQNTVLTWGWWER